MERALRLKYQVKVHLSQLRATRLELFLHSHNPLNSSCWRKPKQ